MALTVEAFRRYGAFNAEEQDADLQAFLDAAAETFALAGVAARQRSALYDLGVKMLALRYHDYPAAIGDPAAELPLGVQSMIHQLRNAAPEEASL